MKVKRFSRRDPMLPLEKQFRADPEIEKKYGKLKIAIHTTKRYEDDLSKHYSVERKTIRKLKEDIMDGYLYEDGPAGGDTHYLSDYSVENDHHTLSKYVTSSDRLNYIVYRPDLRKNEETGELEYIQDIVLASCKEHYGYGVGTYSETEDEDITGS